MTNKLSGSIKATALLAIMNGFGFNIYAADSLTCSSGVVLVEQKGSASVATCTNSPAQVVAPVVAPAPVQQVAVKPVTLTDLSVDSRNYLAANMVVWYAFEQKKAMVRSRPQQGINNIPGFSFVQALFYRDGLENSKSTSGSGITEIEVKMMPAWTCVYSKVNTGTTWQLLDVHVANSISKGYSDVLGADAAKVTTANIDSLMSIYSKQNLSEVAAVMDEWISANLPGKSYASIMNDLKKHASVVYSLKQSSTIKVVDNSKLIVDFLKNLNFTITNGKTICQ